MRVTQFDVASIAGVSRKTVSNVINGYPHISPEVIERVNAAIVQLGYTPSRVARSLRSGRTRTIQLIIPELDVSYFAELARWVVIAAEERKLAVIITQTLGDSSRERQAIGGELSEYVDGTILSPVSSDLSTISSRLAHSPIILVGELAGGGSLTHIGIDNVAAARVATEHLVEIGRERIAFIGAQPDPTSRMAQMRLAGYRDALTAAGRGFEEHLVVHTKGYHRADGAAAMQRLLSSPQVPDAVFCATDLLAMGAMRTARDRGIDVPADLAVVGFDDIEEGRYSAPTLTTVSPDKRQIAVLAVTRVEAAISGDWTAGQEYVVPFTLARRESTGTC